jgi:hypothetical protein
LTIALTNKTFQKPYKEQHLKKSAQSSKIKKLLLLLLQLSAAQ